MKDNEQNSFYEEDEPIADISAAWIRGERGITRNQATQSIVVSATFVTVSNLSINPDRPVEIQDRKSITVG